MPEETVKGVELKETGTRSWEPRDYAQSDVHQAIKDANNPTSWQDLVNFLEHHAQNRWHLEPGEVIAMKQDAESAMKAGKSFSPDASKIYLEMHGFRSQNQQAGSASR